MPASVSVSVSAYVSENVITFMSSATIIDSLPEIVTRVLLNMIFGFLKSYLPSLCVFYSD